MAKPTKHAALICIICSILALLGIILGLVFSKALITILFLLPAVIYEVYRTEGWSTKWASWGLLIVFIAELILVIFNISFDLGVWLGVSEKYVGGHQVPLGDIKIFGPIVMVILSVILFMRTYGRYTKWLSVIIFITSFAIVYILNPDIFGQLLRLGVEEGLERIY